MLAAGLQLGLRYLERVGNRDLIFSLSLFGVFFFLGLGW